MVVDICIHTARSGGQFPIGDSLVSLCLSLANDKITALDIPLLAQFIVCPRKRLSTIEIFQQEGIVTSDMLDQEDIFENGKTIGTEERTIYSKMSSHY